MASLGHNELTHCGWSCHSATLNWVNMGWGKACCLTAPSYYITWTNVDLSSVRSVDIHLRAILQERTQPSITKISLQITSLKLQSNLQSTNESLIMQILICVISLYSIIFLILECWLSSIIFHNLATHKGTSMKHLRHTYIWQKARPQDVALNVIKHSTIKNFITNN